MSSPSRLRTLVVLAPFVKFGMLAIGIISFINTIAGLFSGTSFTETQRFQIRSIAAANLAFYGLIGWMLSASSRTRRRARCARRSGPRRGADDRGGRGPAGLGPGAGGRRAGAEADDGATGSDQEDDDPRAHQLADFHAAVEAAQWHRAAELAGSFTARYPDDPEALN